MSKLTESAIEDFAIKLFERLGIAMFMRRMATLLPKLMSGKVRVELMPDTQGRKYNRVNVAG